MAIVIPPATVTYLTAIKAGLQAGNILDAPDNTVTAPGRNYLEAMDMANVLEMLQDTMCSASTTLTASGGGTTTTVVDAAAFVANTMIGNTITFDAATATVVLRGLSRKVISNTSGALTLDSPLPAVTACSGTGSQRRPEAMTVTVSGYSPRRAASRTVSRRGSSGCTSRCTATRVLLGRS